MTPRERVQAALNHQTPDRTPLDCGGTLVSSIAASTYTKLRAALGLPYMPAKIVEPFQILPEVEEEVRALLGIDTMPVTIPGTSFGFRNEGWKPWRLFDGTEVQVPAKFVTTTDEKGDVYIYPGGDLSAPPSGHMPHGGFYFDPIVRQQPIDENDLRPEDWVEGLGPIPDEDLADLQRQADTLYANTDYALTCWFGQGGLGDIAFVPAAWMKHPKGIRSPELWYMAHLLYPEYIKGIYALQTEIALQNLKLLHQAIGDKVAVVALSGTDFGMQSGPFVSPDSYREFFKPHHARMNAWIHANTGWKVMFHTCGSIVAFLDDFIEAGVDIINPVQCSAAGMEPETLKAQWGDRLVFWGAAVDTQRILPFGTPDEVRAQTSERLRVLGAGGGLVAAAIHNIQPNTPVENVLAFFETVRDSGAVPA